MNNILLLLLVAILFVSSTAFVSVGRAFLYKHETGMLLFLIKTKFYNHLLFYFKQNFIIIFFFILKYTLIDNLISQKTFFSIVLIDLL